jgi:photosystem II stability/assembly factor-like uncharacterized protein
MSADIRHQSRAAQAGRKHFRPGFDFLEDRTLPSGLTWNSLGPAPINDHIYLGGNATSGRVTGLAADPTNAHVLYAATATGGAWKTTDAGTSWAPLTDNQATLVMGAIAVAPGAPTTIYAGTGEATNSGDSFYGRGVLKSADGGTTWTLLTGNAGKNEFDRHTIARIVVDPSSASTVYVVVCNPGVNGKWFDNDEGVWKSADGGTTWTQTTKNISQSAGFSDLVMDPTNDQVLFAAVGSPSGDPANGVYKSTDGGQHWAAAGNFPMGSGDGNIKLAIAPTNHLELFASVVDPSTGGLLEMLESSDGGSTWNALPNVPDYLYPQGAYDSSLIVDPFDRPVRRHRPRPAGRERRLRRRPGQRHREIHRDAGLEPDLRRRRRQRARGPRQPLDGLLRDRARAKLLRLPLPQRRRRLHLDRHQQLDLRHQPGRPVRLLPALRDGRVQPGTPGPGHRPRLRNHQQGRQLDRHRQPERQRL